MIYTNWGLMDTMKRAINDSRKMIHGKRTTYS